MRGRLSVLHSDQLQSRHADQQRVRLQDRVPGSSPAGQRRHLSGRLEEHHRRVLRPAAGLRQPDLRDQRTQLPGPGRRAAGRRARDRGLDGSRIGLVQQEHPAQFALLVNNNPASPNFGKPLLGSNGHRSNVFGLQGSPLGESPVFQGNMRVRYEFPLGDYKAFTPGRRPVLRRSVSTIGTVDNYDMGGWATFDAAAGVAKDALERAVLRAEPCRQERQHLHELRPVHPDARRRCGRESRGQVRLQVLRGRMN